jgi:hypothetical protein
MRCAFQIRSDGALEIRLMSAGEKSGTGRDAGRRDWASLHLGLA